jgi:hypothetical protein
VLERPTRATGMGVMACVSLLEEFMPAPPTGDARARARKDLFVLLKGPPDSRRSRAGWRATIADPSE